MYSWAALSEHACVAVMANTTLPPLPNNLAFWRVAKLPVAEIRQRLEEAELQTTGTKSQLARRLHDHLGSLAADSASGSASSPSAGRSTPQASPPVSNDQVNSPRRGLPRRHRRSRRHMRTSASGAATTTGDGLPRATGAHKHTVTRTGSAAEDGHHRRHRRRRSRASSSPETRCESRSCSYTTSTSASSTSPSSSDHTGRSSSSSSSRATSPSPVRGRRHRRPTRRSGRGRSRAARSATTAAHTRSRSGRHGRQLHRRHDGHRHRHHRCHQRTAGALSPIPGRLKRRIRRGEYVDLALLLHANLNASASGAKRNGSRRAASHTSTITDYASWAEAWCVYAAVLCSFYPHLAPRLFLYQHFVTLKSRSFQATAWLRYDAQFRLKLAANNSWDFDAVDTELWASCFAADGLSHATPAANTLACFTCGSLSHLYASCPQRRRPGPSQQPTAGPKSDHR